MKGLNIVPKTHKSKHRDIFLDRGHQGIFEEDSSQDIILLQKHS